MLVFAPLAEQLALPALAGLLLVTAWSMSEPQRWRERLELPRIDSALLLLTAALTVLADLTVAIAVGTMLGLAQRLAKGEVELPRWHVPQRGLKERD
jgi:SulP family sulfate permease